MCVRVLFSSCYMVLVGWFSFDVMYENVKPKYNIILKKTFESDENELRRIQTEYDFRHERKTIFFIFVFV